MRTVWKYELPNWETGSAFIGLPEGCSVLEFGMQGRRMFVWVELDRDDYEQRKRMQTRRFHIVGTGHDIPEPLRPGGHVSHRSTLFDGAYVWHVYEEWVL